MVKGAADSSIYIDSANSMHGFQVRKLISAWPEPQLRDYL